MIFSYFKNFASKAEICKKEDFYRLIALPEVAQHIKEYRAGDESAKKKLPAFCFVSSFPSGRRKSDDAVASGLGMLDLDKGDEKRIREIAEKMIPAEDERDSSPIMLVHITPSGKGLRVVYKCTNKGIFSDCRKVTDYQRKLAEHFAALDLLDSVCHDPARLSFVPQQSDVLYIHERMFFEAPEVTTFESETACSPAVPKLQRPTNTILTMPEQRDYQGIPLDEIFAEYVALSGGTPEQGSRNSRYYAAARDLRYICDFNPAVIAKHLPDVGLPSSELYQLCSSACQSSRGATIPYLVSRSVDICKAKRNVAADEENAADEETCTMQEMKFVPRLARDFIKISPDDFKEPTLLSLLPIVGTLATNLRATYMDGEVHSPSFFTVVSAEQASGKSFARRLVNQLLSSIAAEDAEQRLIEQQYKEECKKKKNDKKQPEQPRVKIRLVPASISVAKLLQRLDFSEGEHLFSFAEEMDTLIKSNRSGAWAEKSDIYRESFDNAVYGQDFMSDSSYSTQVKVFYNLLVLGTPRQCSKFFANVENGLVSRVCLASIPDQFGCLMPHFAKLTSKDLAQIDSCVATLRAAKGNVNLDFLFPTLERWLDEQRILALQQNNRARDIFRRRAAVIAFRSVLAFSPLYSLSNTKNRANLCKFAESIANIVLRNQLVFAEQKLNDLINNDGETTGRHSKVRDIFASIRDTFSTQDVAAALRQCDMASPARNVISRWVRAGLAEKIEKNKFRKTNGTNAKKNKTLK